MLLYTTMTSNIGLIRYFTTLFICSILMPTTTSQGVDPSYRDDRQVSSCCFTGYVLIHSNVVYSARKTCLVVLLITMFEYVIRNTTAQRSYVKVRAALIHIQVFYTSGLHGFTLTHTL